MRIKIQEDFGDLAVSCTWLYSDRSPRKHVFRCTIDIRSDDSQTEGMKLAKTYPACFRAR
jgi:hypothetical protein